MPQPTTEMFLDIDAGQGGAPTVVNDRLELTAALVENTLEGIAFSPVGLARNTQLPGKVSAGTTTEIKFIAEPDATDPVYRALLDSYIAKDQVTITWAANQTSPGSLTNPLHTVKGIINTNPALMGLVPGEPLAAKFTMFVDETIWDDGVTTITE